MFEVSMFSPLASSGAPSSHRLTCAHQRCAARQADQVLAECTRAWLHRLPLRRRPLRLAVQFPRVANRIALCWAEPALLEQVLDDLLVDRRGGRRGFPALVVRELQRLAAYGLH